RDAGPALGDLRRDQAARGAEAFFLGRDRGLQPLDLVPVLGRITPARAGEQDLRELAAQLREALPGGARIAAQAAGQRLLRARLCVEHDALSAQDQLESEAYRLRIGGKASLHEREGG